MGRAIRAALLGAAASLAIGCADPSGPPGPTSGEWDSLGLDGLWVITLARSGDELFAGTEDGVYRTRLGSGASAWTPAGLKGHAVRSVLPLDLETVFASVYVTGMGDDTLSLWRTTNGGASWEPYQNGFGAGGGTSAAGALSMLPGAPTTLLATGGSTMVVARSEDAGGSWHLVWGDWQFGAMGTHFVLADPARPGVVWAGGEASLLLPFVVRSADGGIHWQQLQLPNTGGDNACYRVAIDPRDSDRVYVGMEGLVMVTADAGQTWRTVLTAPAYFRGLATSRTRPGRVYAAASHVGPDVEQPIRLYVSDDAGSSWHVLAHDATLGTSWDLLRWHAGDAEQLVVATAAGVYRFTPTP